ncbi:hypothetical protein D6D02_09526 [Aureobasidium pullulans]|nr:hypothetical protein D6D02_09526 [Aureobasidium pullulans]
MLIQHVIPICLAGIVAAVTQAESPTNESSDIALVKFNTQSHPGLCKTWLNGDQQSSLIQGMASSELTSACNCISEASKEMKLALQLPVVRVAKTTAKAAAKPVPKTTAKPSPKTTAKTTLQTTTKVTAPSIKTTPKVSIKTTPAISTKKTSTGKLSSTSVKLSSKSSSVSSSSTRRCVGIACSKLTAKTSSTTSTKNSSTLKSLTNAASILKPGSKVSSTVSASKSGSKSGSKVLSSITGTATGNKGISTKKSSSSTRKAKSTSSSSTGDGSGATTGGDDSGSGSDGGDGGDDGSAATTPSGDDSSAPTTPSGDDGSAATTTAADDGSSATAPADDGSLATSTSTLPASTSTSTKPRSVSLPTTTKSSTRAATLVNKSTTPVSSAPTSVVSTSSTASSSTSSMLPVIKPSPICTSPLSANETFQLYISGTNTAIDGTPMQGLTNGATAVGFSVGYTTLNFTLDCTTGYVYWGSGSVLSGNRQAFSVKSQSVVVAPLGDSNNSPLSCSLDTNFVMTCQYTSSRSPDPFQGWAVSTGDARYLAMAQSNTTGVALKAIPLKSNSAITYPTHSTNQKLLTNGDFAASSVSPWNKFTQGRSSDVSFNAPAVNASQSCYAFAGMLSITPNSQFYNGYAWGGMSQPGVTLYMGEQLFLGYDVLLNYPTGLPAGVRCDIQVKGTEHDTLSYVRYDSNSPAFVSFNTTTTASYNGTGSFSITAYCQGQPGGPWPNLNLGFNNVRLLAAYDPTDAGAALSCGFKNARDTIQSATLQPYCSSLLSYSTPTTTVTSVIPTTTTVVITMTSAGRKRSFITAAPIILPQTIWPRQLDVSANTSSQASTIFDGSTNPLASFAPQDVSDACSIEASAVSTTVTVSTSVTSTIVATSTKTKVAACSSTPVYNGDFESGSLNPWNVYDPVGGRGGAWTVEPVSGPSGGNYVAQVTMKNPGDVGGFAAFISQTVQTCTGITYTMSYDYQCLTKSYAAPYILIQAPGGNAYGGQGDCSAGPNGWKTQTLTYVSKGDSVQPGIWAVQNGGPSDQGIIQIDNVKFTASAPSCTNGEIDNSDFANGLSSWDSLVQSGTVTMNGEAAQLYCNAHDTGPYDKSKVTQTISTCPGTKYSVSWRYLIPAINGNEDTYIYLYTADSVKSENIISATSSHNGEQVDGNNQPIGTWYTQTATFTANDKSTLIGVENVCCNNNEFTILIDDIVVSVAS